MNRAQEYFANFGEWEINEYVAKYILSNPSEMERLGAILKIIPESVSTLLDVGCGLGIFLHLLDREYGIKGIGVEITESKIKYAQRTLNVQAIKGDVGNLPFGDQSFDVVTALELIEHLPYDTYERALEEIQRVAKKWIIVSVPYKEKRTFIRCPYCGASFDPNFHMRSFDRKKLLELFPHFELNRIQKIRTTTQYPRMFKDILAFFIKRPFPEFAICPACGFKENVQRQGYSVKIPSIFLRIGSQFISFLPIRRKQYRWAIAFYGRARV